MSDCCGNGIPILRVGLRREGREGRRQGVPARRALLGIARADRRARGGRGARRVLGHRHRRGNRRGPPRVAAARRGARGRPRRVQRLPRRRHRGGRAAGVRRPRRARPRRRRPGRPDGPAGGSRRARPRHLLLRRRLGPAGRGDRARVAAHRACLSARQLVGPRRGEPEQPAVLPRVGRLPVPRPSPRDRRGPPARCRLRAARRPARLAVAGRDLGAGGRRPTPAG